MAVVSCEVVPVPVCLAVSHGRVQIGLNRHLVQRLWTAKINEPENWAMRGEGCVDHLQDSTLEKD